MAPEKKSAGRSSKKKSKGVLKKEVAKRREKNQETTEEMRRRCGKTIRRKKGDRTKATVRKRKTGGRGNKGCKNGGQGKQDIARTKKRSRKYYRAGASQSIANTIQRVSNRL